MRRRTEPPAGTQFKNDLLREIYQRQFHELACLRRHILSLLPISSVERIFEPGCGTGLLGKEILSITDAAYTGMDIDPEILPDHERFTEGDARCDPPEADIYLSSFLFSSLKDPVKWLKKIRTDLFAVVAEYDYLSIEENPPSGIAEKLRAGLSEHGLSTVHGGCLDRYFEEGGYRKLHGGEAESSFQKPDPEFLAMHVKNLPCELPLMKWRIVWGIWRKQR